MAEAARDLLGGDVIAGQGMGGHQSFKAIKEEWLTPPHVLAALGEFDLDPCAPAQRPWDIATMHYTIFDNGLTKPWAGRVFCNPPYGRETGKWLSRMAQHGNGIALVFARIETIDWFDNIWPCATAILFLQGRITFYNSAGRAAIRDGGAPSALLAYGVANAACLLRCGLPGAYIDVASVKLR